jgi:peptidoglycan hydrolase-like protein with peptidoglycan-binding domain
MTDPTPQDAPTDEAASSGDTETSKRAHNVAIAAIGIAVIAVVAAIFAIVQANDAKSDQESTEESAAAQEEHVKNAAAQAQVTAQLQSDLTVLGYYDGPINGVYDEATTDAVKAFQKDQGLKDDGIAGPETMTAIEQALKDQGTTTTAAPTTAAPTTETPTTEAPTTTAAP